MRAKDSLRDLNILLFEHLDKRAKQDYLDQLVERSGEVVTSDTIEVDSINKLKDIFGQ